MVVCVEILVIVEETEGRNRQWHVRASISQDYWGDIKQDWGSGDPSGVQGRSPGRDLEAVSYTHLTLPTIYSV